MSKRTFYILICEVHFLFIIFFFKKNNLKRVLNFCHNRALRDLYPDSYRLLFPAQDLFTSTSSPLLNEPDVQRVQRVRMEGQKPTRACEKYEVLLCRRALEL